MKHSGSLLIYLLIVALIFPAVSVAQNKVVWKIGERDGKTEEFALAPGNYQQFLAHDFGWEDRYYLVGKSSPNTDWPYVLPGPDDSWGGTGPTSGIRSHQLNVLFNLKPIKAGQQFQLIMDVLAYNGKKPPLFKVTINGKDFKFLLPANSKDSGLTGNSKNKAEAYKIDIPAGLLHQGGNAIKMTILEGSWLVFDDVRLEGAAEIQPLKSGDLYIRSVRAADYTIVKDGQKVQPLLVDIEHLANHPEVTVKINGKQILTSAIDTGRYVLEVPMSLSKQPKQTTWQVLSAGKVIAAGSVSVADQPLKTAAGYADTKIGTAHSRWMIAPGPWMPFSMVKLSPDNQNSGWMAGYDPTIESIGTFSHIHEWTMAGLGMMPVNGELKYQIGDQHHKNEGYRSEIDKNTEETPIGYYKVILKKYNIKAELTSSTRCGFQRYTFPKSKDGRVMIDLKVPSEYDYQIKSFKITQVNKRRIEGYSEQHTANAWSGGVDQDYTVHFVIEFDQDIKKVGGWINGKAVSGASISGKDAETAGMYAEFDTQSSGIVQARSGISLVSIAGASQNLREEIEKPFGWKFDAVRTAHVRAWNTLMDRVTISSDNSREKTRFYNNMYRALCSRNTWSDVDGSWIDATEQKRQFSNATDVALGCDAFWNTFWNLNQFWNLVTPEWSSKWVKSQLAMFDANGYLAKGPSGMEYIPVMVAEHEIPLIVGAYQMGIRDYDVQKAFSATYKMQTQPAATVGKGRAGNEDLLPYLEHKYVPYDKGRFSNSLEYSYDDWTVSQFAKALGKDKEYAEFADRGSWWKNVIDTVSGFARMRKSDGTWLPDFDPFKSGANEHYVEGNAWQLTFFVPQDVKGLANRIGKKRFCDRLEWGFKESYKWRFNAPNDAYWDYPIMQGNQQSMHFAFLFNFVQKPWLTQKWSRAIIDRYYGFDIANAYLGDEDQGQMSAWFIMASLGLFQTDGGCSAQPRYEIGSPLFTKVVIDLGNQYGRGKSFTIEAKNTSRMNKYIQSASLNGKVLNSFSFAAAELLKGGKLTLVMGSKPNYNWGL
ncbi:GH92 family glycosyl hydrolase [Pedobacter sp. MC2016-15]|uniref:GH92 family glycosyl hydrolase n=1 Tax=Pedobacter sp. MC2016-15 TaxID=2994473 RepID=UPI0022480F5F|nr:GH92 family glycosyl hydrolase [Pedobacter sp. MC2016-15]MCX2481522.1 GH92 family glycosyl hydrolase [Pedobacter sp. MC2016-15]